MPRLPRRPAACAAFALAAASLGSPTAVAQDAAPDTDFPGFELREDPMEAAAADAPEQPPQASPDPADPADAVPGAASTETVLRCAYRPHPTRVAAVHTFLKAHAAPGVDVSLRTVDPKTGAAVTGVKLVAATEQVARQVGSGETVYERHTVMRPVAADGRPVVQELVVVAPPAVQRAVGAFLQLCLSADPAEDAFRPVPSRLSPLPGDAQFEGFHDPLPEEFSDFEEPASPYRRDDVRSAPLPSAGDFNDFGFGPPADPNEGQAEPADSFGDFTPATDDRPAGNPFGLEPTSVPADDQLFDDRPVEPAGGAGKDS